MLSTCIPTSPAVCQAHSPGAIPRLSLLSKVWPGCVLCPHTQVYFCFRGHPGPGPRFCSGLHQETREPRGGQPAFCPEQRGQAPQEGELRVGFSGDPKARPASGQKGPVPELMLCCHRLKILNYFLTGGLLARSICIGIRRLCSWSNSQKIFPASQGCWESMLETAGPGSPSPSPGHTGYGLCKAAGREDLGVGKGNCPHPVLGTSLREAEA